LPLANQQVQASLLADFPSEEISYRIATLMKSGAHVHP